MILVDTSVWIDHLRRGDPAVAQSLVAGEVLAHEWVIGEIALGHLAQRHEVLTLLRQLPQAQLATEAETASLVERARLHGRGIGYVDAQLVAATRITADATLWTRDKRLRQVATDLGCDAGRA